MKRLLMLRHASAGSAPRDHERPLTAAGRAEADELGGWLERLDEVPDLVLASSAARARTTVERAAAAGGWRSEIDVDQTLYDTSASHLLELLQGLPEAIESVLIAGHEPTCSELVSGLLGHAPLLFPPAGLARLDLYIRRWRDLGPQRAALVWFSTPQTRDGAPG